VKGKKFSVRLNTTAGSIEFQKIGLEKCKFKRMMEAQRFSEEKYFISPSRSAIH